jgi:hypothetical protein
VDKIRAVRVSDTAVFEQLIQFQTRIGIDARAIFPVRNLTTTALHGGAVVVAYAASSLIGYTALIPGRRDGKVIGWCPQMLIDPEADQDRCRLELFRAIFNISYEKRIEQIQWAMASTQLAELAWQFANLDRLKISGFCQLSQNLTPFDAGNISLLLSCPTAISPERCISDVGESLVICDCTPLLIAELVEEKFEQAFALGKTINNIQEETGQWLAELST